MRIRAYDEFRKIVGTRWPDTKLKRVKKVRAQVWFINWSLKRNIARQEILRLEKANDGDPRALRIVINNAYGRTGKLNWELIEVC